MKILLTFLLFCISFGSHLFAQEELLVLSRVSCRDLNEHPLKENETVRKAKYAAENFPDLQKVIAQCSGAEELHLELPLCVNDSALQLCLLELRKCVSLRVLTIHPAMWPYGMQGEEEGPGCSSPVNPMPLDLSFLEGMPDLRILAISWGFEVIGEEKIAGPGKLVYAQLPLTAFNLLLFRSASLLQLEFGRDGEIVLLRPRTEKMITVATEDYAVAFSRRNNGYIAFLKQNAKQKEKLLSWPSDFVKLNESGDTIIYLSEAANGITSWKMPSLPGGQMVTGTMTSTFSGSFTELRRTWKEGIVYREFNRQPDGTFHIVSKYNNPGNPGLESHRDEYGYRNGGRHGVFLHASEGSVQTKQIYEDGMLRYAYPYYSESLPELPLIYGLNDVKWDNIFMKEAFFNEEGLYLVLGHSKNFGANTASEILPFREGKLHGKVILLDRDGDTTLIATLKNGVLDGSYYKSSPNYNGSSTTVRQTYRNGSLEGRRTVNRESETAVSYYENGRMISLVTTYNSNGRTYERIIWIPEKNQYEETIWLPNGKLLSKRILDSNYREVSRKQYCRDDELPRQDPVQP